jgi:hypothetical protein
MHASGSSASTCLVTYQQIVQAGRLLERLGDLVGAELQLRQAAESEDTPAEAALRNLLED